MDEIDLKNTLKSVKFGEVVKQIKDRIKDIENSNLTEYTRGEHFESSNLNLIGRSKIGDGQHGSAFHMRFRNRDVLYISRNPQLRKVAVADYDGICANTTYVYRADNKILSHELLPFIMQTDHFVEFTIQHKRGSTNFYLNPSDIDPYEFYIPSLNEQQKIAKLFLAIENTLNNYKNTLKKLLVLKKSYLNSTITQGISEGWPLVLFDSILIDTQYGISKKSEFQSEGRVPILGIPNIVAGDTDFSKIAWVKITNSEFEKYKIHKNDILIVRTNGNPNYVGRCVTLKIFPENSVYASYLIKLKVHENIAIPSYIEAIINSDFLRANLQHEIRSSAGNYNLNTQGIRKQLIPLPPIETQKGILNILETINTSQKSFELQINNTLLLKKSFMNKYLMNLK